MTVEPYEERAQRGGDDAVREASRFLYGEGPVRQALARIAGKLETLGIPYAVAGGMAVVAHGYERTTVDVDVVVTAEGLQEVLGKLEGSEYGIVIPGGRQLRDTETGVRIDFIVSESYCDPIRSSSRMDGIRYVNLERLIEMKLIFGMAKPGRLKHLADVQELIKELGLKSEFEEKLHPYVRAMYAQLWREVHENPP